MKKELAASSLKLFGFIHEHADMTGRVWYSELPMTSTFRDDCLVLVDLGLIDIKSGNTHPAYIRLTNKGTDFAKEL